MTFRFSFHILMTKDRLLGSHELQRTSNTPTVYAISDFFIYVLRLAGYVRVLIYVKIKKYNETIVEE